MTTRRTIRAKDLMQTKVITLSPDATVAEAIETFEDLPDMIRTADELPRDCELRTHCHIPLTVRRIGPLESTVDELDDTFFAALRTGVCGHVEVETYTFSVLPENLRREGVDASVAAELAWVRDRLNDPGVSGPTIPR